MNLDRVIAVRNSKTVYRDGDRCVKVFGSDYSKAEVINEALNQARIEETGLKIPKILEVATIDGKWAIISEYIKGKTLDSLAVENPTKKDEYIKTFVDLQLSVHSKTCPLLTKTKDKLERKISSAKIDGEMRDKLLSDLKNLQDGNNVCHGDFNFSNVIISDDETPYILDWSHATQGNAFIDVAKTYLSFKLSGDSEGAEKYLETFTEKTGTEKRTVQKLIPAVAVSMLNKSNEKERELLLSLINVKDYE